MVVDSSQGHPASTLIAMYVIEMIEGEKGKTLGLTDFLGIARHIHTEDCRTCRFLAEALEPIVRDYFTFLREINEKEFLTVKTCLRGEPDNLKNYPRSLHSILSVYCWSTFHLPHCPACQEYASPSTGEEQVVKRLFAYVFEALSSKSVITERSALVMLCAIFTEKIREQFDYCLSVILLNMVRREAASRNILLRHQDAMESKIERLARSLRREFIICPSKSLMEVASENVTRYFNHLEAQQRLYRQMRQEGRWEV